MESSPAVSYARLLSIALAAASCTVHCTNYFSLLRLRTYSYDVCSLKSSIEATQMSRVFSKRLSVSSATRPPSQRLKKAETRLGTKATGFGQESDKTLDKSR